MSDRIELMLEAERRGILPPEKAALLAEARRRGLIGDSSAQGPVAEEPEQPAPIAGQQEPQPAPQEMSAADTALGVTELVTAEGTSAVGDVVSGLAGIGEGLNPFSAPGAASQRVHSVKDAIEYKPGPKGQAVAREAGQSLSDLRASAKRAATMSDNPFVVGIGSLIDAVEGGVSAASESPDAVADQFGPAAGAAAATLPAAIGLIPAARGGKALARVDDVDLPARGERPTQGAERFDGVDESPDAPGTKPTDEANIVRLLKEKSGDARTAGFKLDGNKAVPDPVARRAIKQGFDKGVVATIEAADPIDRQKMRRMLAIRKRGASDPKFRNRNRASDVLGDSLMERARVVAMKNREAGENIDKIAVTLKGRPVDVSGAVNKFVSDLDRMGVSLGDDLKLDFTGSDIEFSKGVKTTLKNIVQAMSRGDAPDAFAVHRMKRLIDEQVTYGKNKKGLSGKAEIALKNLRRNLDSELDAQFPEYNEVNSIYSETREVLDSLQDIAGKRADLTGPNIEKQLGTLSRRISSNAQSRIPLRNAVDAIEEVARKYSEEIRDDLDAQIVFINELERRFGSDAATSFQGQIAQPIEGGIEILGRAATQGSGRTLVDLGESLTRAAVQKARGVSDEKALEAIGELLKR